MPLAAEKMANLKKNRCPARTACAAAEGIAHSPDL